MPAVQPVDYDNAKVDLTFVGNYANSTLPTAVDRLGRTRRTIAGVDVVLDIKVTDVEAKRVQAVADINAKVSNVEGVVVAAVEASVAASAEDRAATEEAQRQYNLRNYPDTYPSVPSTRPDGSAPQIGDRAMVYVDGQARGLTFYGEPEGWKIPDPDSIDVENRLTRMDLGRTSPQQYHAYLPAITRGSIVSGASSVHKYNHDASLQFFGDRWFALWNANEDGREGYPPQYLLSRTSLDFVTWTPPVKAFNDAAYSNNPVTLPLDGAQWQPGTAVISNEGQDELWALWFQGGTDGNTYFSRLTSPTGKWTNTPLNLMPYVSGDITYVEAFVTGDLLQLPTGRVLVPVVLQSNTLASVPGGLPSGGFIARLKLAGVIFTDDLGATWHIGGMATVPGALWSVWEPFLTQQGDGSVRMNVRSLNTLGSADTQMLTAISLDDGEAFSALLPVRVNTVSARGTAISRAQTAAPSLMLINDHAKLNTVSSTADRRNLACWVGTGANDAVPGARISDDDVDIGPCYPSARIKDGKLYVLYSTYQGTQGYCTDIRTAVLDPAPGYGTLLPRGNAEVRVSPEFVTAPYRALRYATSMTFRSVALLSGLSGTAFSVALVGVLGGNQTALLDTRTPDTSAGLLIKLSSAQHVVIGTVYGGVYSEVDSGIVVPTDECYVGISIDVAGNVTVVAVQKNGTATSNTVSLGHGLTTLAPAQYAYIGCARSVTSVPTMVGLLRAAKVFGSALSVDQHRSIQNAYAAGIGMTAWAGSTAAPPAAAIDLDATSADAGTNNSAWLALFSATGLFGGRIEHVTIDGREAIKIIGAASVSVTPPFDAGGKIHYRFAYRSSAARTADTPLLTVGGVDKCLTLLKSPAGVIKAHWRNSTVISSDATLGTGSADDTWYIVHVIFTDGGRLVINHEGCAPLSTRFSGRPLIVVGDAWPVGGGDTNAVFLDVSSVKAKAAVIAESAYESDALQMMTPAASADVSMRMQLPTELYPRWEVTAAGEFRMGSGAANPDVSLTRRVATVTGLGVPTNTSFITPGVWNAGRHWVNTESFWKDVTNNVMRKRASGIATSEQDGDVLGTRVAFPASSSAAGTPGMWSSNSTQLAVCIAAGSWKFINFTS